MTVHFCVHDEGDSVGVVVVEGIKSGQALNGWIMDQDKMITFNAKSDIPIGHKLAIQRLAGFDPFNNNDADGIAFVMHTEMHGHAGKSSLLIMMDGS